MRLLHVSVLLTTLHPGATTPSTDGEGTPLAGQLAHTLLWAGVPKLG